MLSYDLEDITSKTIESTYSTYISFKSSLTKPLNMASISLPYQSHLPCTSHRSNRKFIFLLMLNYVFFLIHLSIYQASYHKIHLILGRYHLILYLDSCLVCLNICWRFYRLMNIDFWCRGWCLVRGGIRLAFIIFIFVRRRIIRSFGTIIRLFKRISRRSLIACSFLKYCRHNIGEVLWFMWWLSWFWISYVWWHHEERCCRYLEHANLGQPHILRAI